MHDTASKITAVNDVTWLSIPAARLGPYIGVSPRRVWQLIKLGELKATKIGGKTVVRRVDVEAFLQRLHDEQHPAEPISA